MSTTRRKFSKEFKSRVVLESLKERETLESLAKKYELTPTQISIWRSLALKNFGNVFTSESSEDRGSDIDRQRLSILKKILWLIHRLSCGRNDSC